VCLRQINTASYIGAFKYQSSCNSLNIKTCTHLGKNSTL